MSRLESLPSNSGYDLDVLVVGGGISGLATAWWLAQSALTVQVWEQSARAGGKIKTDRIDGFQTEQAASMIMNFKPEVDQFFRQSGLQQQQAARLLKSESKRYLIHKGHLQALPMTITRLFFSPLWSHSGKFRLLMEPFIAKGHKNNETVSEFVTRRFGHEFLEKAMEPFISGTLASDPDLACAQHVLPRLTALEQRFGSITAGIVAHRIMGKRTARNPESFSFNGGMKTLTQQLANDPALGFQANYGVQKIIRHGHYNWEVQAHTPEGDIQRTARHVVLSSPVEAASRLLKPLNYRLSQLLSSIEYVPLSVVHIGLERSAIKHPLDSAGFLVPRQEKMAINGNLWMSSLFTDRAPHDKVLLSSYLGGSRHPSAIELSTQDSVDRVLQDLAPLLGINSTPVMGRVDKHHKALPLYHGDYHHKLKAIEYELQTLAGMHLQANYKGGVSVRDRIVAGQKAAADIVAQLPAQNHSIQRAVFTRSLIEKPA
ncbi:MAG: protoporphyrinogen oxidase [Gammaproteobacteria bacterium]|nr:protoporphyrinogen oxidase [Gammaproteobacteria bacterium]